MSVDKIFNLFGLALRARAARTGTFGVSAAIKDGNAKIVLIASDMSEAQKDKLIKLCEYNNTPYIEIADRDTFSFKLGGKDCVCGVITDNNFYNGIKKILDNKLNQ